uniref:Uncharacterized protein n=1 Tax=Meloidogyne enterolobii TaxID=390850 RepID=A0A6V7VRQ8_MELEN|nr:unnamed protein product [Meloidogyne enterolobii]
MPKDVHHLNVYAWKIYIIAEIYSKYDTFVWMDTSIVINDASSFNPIFEAFEKDVISGTVFPGRTYTYLPLLTNWIKIENNEWDKDMYEANFIIMHKSEDTRQILKWYKVLITARSYN